LSFLKTNRIRARQKTPTVAPGENAKKTAEYFVARIVVATFVVDVADVWPGLG